MIVVDASVAVDALVPSGRRAAAHAELQHGGGLVAPAVIDGEVLSAIARLERAGVITGSEADFAVELWGELPLDRVESVSLLTDAWALRRNVSLTDAFYVALAHRLDCPLVTSDLRLARAPIRGVEFRAVSAQ